MTLYRTFLVFAVSLLTAAPSARCSEPKLDVKEMMSQAGVSAGFVVHLGAGDGRVTAELRQNELIQVHGLESDFSNVSAARKHIQSEKSDSNP